MSNAAALARIAGSWATEALPPPPERRRIRKAAGLSQGAVAAAVGVGQPELSRAERGTVQLRPEARARYAHLLELLARIE